MTPDELKTRAPRAAEEISSQGDLAAGNEFISPDCLHYIPGGRSVPGLDALRDWLALTLNIFPDFHAIVKARDRRNGQVIQRTCYGTHEREFSGVRPAASRWHFRSSSQPGRHQRAIRRAPVIGRPAPVPADAAAIRA